MFNEFIQSPCGIVEVQACDQGITAIRFVESEASASVPSAVTTKACTLFQQRVWNALRDIPYGATCSYRDIAEAIDNPKGVRAVGLANGKNPIAIVIPCHRVIGANGKLTGYAGGLHRKATLLELEGAL